jgi:hypothetical protein
MPAPRRAYSRGLRSQRREGEQRGQADEIAPRLDSVTPAAGQLQFHAVRVGHQRVGQRNVNGAAASFAEHEPFQEQLDSAHAEHDHDHDHDAPGAYAPKTSASKASRSPSSENANPQMPAAIITIPSVQYQGRRGERKKESGRSATTRRAPW